MATCRQLHALVTGLLIARRWIEILTFRHSSMEEKIRISWTYIINSIIHLSLFLFFVCFQVFCRGAPRTVMLIWRTNWAPLLRSPWREKMAKTVSTFPCLQRRMVKANDVPSNKSNLIGFVGLNVAAAMLIAGNYACRSAEPAKWRREASFEWRKTRCLHQMMLVWFWCTNTNIYLKLRWDEFFWQTSNDYRASKVCCTLLRVPIKFIIFFGSGFAMFPLRAIWECQSKHIGRKENPMKNGKSIVATFLLSSIVFNWLLISSFFATGKAAEKRKQNLPL